ncbi:xanthine dehydrogenase family protein molybdopterin-binding subunit [Aminobacter aminovorans]|uniref:Aldehyde oxidase and xanthine dehydrogenase, molybdopterin binding protein n=1 Tax=Aminobacter aminovorans TaxID=83263 RepID=A0AAC8YVW1_AMIAI|nr:xanthine dehydrogenase family protein molybdopterin-binding subunit [Aminobacter aminovorans]AMS45476.1 Aldehyde oxidase and xanthine dehydrogenase, molybdopterin binding protein [Aminobacter aminovorans]MBB3708683.1 carbon-monoxide dehydrogenase large subunit [Aminobacter aminovorans]
MNEGGIGSSLKRREDVRHLHGRGKFAADIKIVGMQDVAFVRSPVAHARLLSVTKPDSASHRVFTFHDLTDVKPLTTPITTPGYQHSECPVLATEKLRFVGEPIAACVAASRALAEDLADAVVVDFEELPPVPSADRALAADAPLIHDSWKDNRFVELLREDDFSNIEGQAPIRVEVEAELSRQTIHPLEGRAIVAHWDHNASQLVLAMSTQIPHPIRQGVADILGIPESMVRVAPPDIGGGFGYKLQLLPEELAVAWLALTFKSAFRWIEDRREHLVAGANTRQAKYRLTGYATPQGRLLGLDADIVIDNGAYSVWPFTAALEGYSARSNLPGPYDLKCYRAKVTVVATNKPGFCPYRGIARVGTCLAMETLIDAIARAVGREACEVRAENLVPPEAMPFTDVTGKHFDIGNYPETLRTAREMIGLDQFRAQAKDRQKDRGQLLTGIGFATFYEQTANGPSFYAPWNMPIVPGYDQATVKLAPDGTLEVRMGLQGFGQGIETSLAQVASTHTGIHPDNIRVRLGDTEDTPHSIGSFTSRSIVVGAGAIENAAKIVVERIKAVAASLMQVDKSTIELSDGSARSGAASITLRELARIFYHRANQLPAEVEAGSLEATAGYKPPVESGIFAYGTHAVKVALNLTTGQVDILDYVIVEDCGQMVNPMIVKGQTIGGAAQGIGTALFEESPYDESGQPLASTLLDYLLPGANEVPRFRIAHIENKSPHTSFGIKGVGESGCIPPAAALANAINDALSGTGALVSTLPITPARVLAELEKAKAETRT